MSSRNETSKNETRELDSSDEETPINPEVRILSRIFGVHRASVASIPGTSGVGHSVAVSPAPAPRRTPRQERDRLFWTLLGNSSRSPNSRSRGSTGARVPRPTTFADLLEPDRHLSALTRPTRATSTGTGRCRTDRRPQVQPNLRPPCPFSATTTASGYKPSTSYTSFQTSLRNLLRKRNQDREASSSGNDIPESERHDQVAPMQMSSSLRETGAGPSGGRQVYVVHARGERGERRERGEREEREERAEEEADRSAASGGADDTATALADDIAEEPINMSTVNMLVEEILEVEPEAPAERPAPPEDAEPASGSTESNQPARATKRKREVTGDTHESVSALNQSILRLLECPVCMEWMEPPIAQCRRGHLVCGACRKRLDTCPVCRTPFSSVRNRAMEDVASILRYPCRHGCGREVRSARRHKHEASCAARRHSCPLPPCRAAPPMPRSKLAQHCQSKHPGAYKTGAVHRLSLPVSCEQHVQWVVSALGALFHVRVDMDVRAWGVLALVAHLGPVDRAPNYTYEVVVNGRHNARRLVYTRATHSDLENSVLNTSRQDCFHLTLDQALNYLRFKNEHSETDKTLDLTITLAEAEAEDDAEPVADEG